MFSCEFCEISHNSLTWWYVLKISLQDVLEMSSKRLEDALKTFLQDVLKMYVQDKYRNPGIFWYTLTGISVDPTEAAGGVLWEKVFLEISQNSQEITCARDSSLIKVTSCYRPEACNVIKKETLAQVFFCEFCKISQNTFFSEHLCTTASDPILLVGIALRPAIF